MGPNSLRVDRVIFERYKKLRTPRMFKRKRNRLYPRGTAVCEVLAIANENGSQITCYTANDDWLFMTCYILESITYVPHGSLTCPVA